MSECKITRRCEGELINNDDHHTAVHCKGDGVEQDE